VQYLEIPIEKNAPFFSVCIEIFNREDTIELVLQHVNKQTCRDFELIIVDNGSTDKSAEIVSRAIHMFQDIETKFVKEEKKSNAISGWNSPLRLAKGNYIAICEGDDYYHKDHLKQAKALLNKTPGVGIYVGGSKLEKFDLYPACLQASEVLQKLKMMEWCPPPSCVVFTRLSKGNKPYFFEEKFVWAGEYSLYYAILMDKFKVIENNTMNFVLRGYRFYLKDSFHMQDALEIRHGNYFVYSDFERYKVDSVFFYRALHLFVFNLIFAKVDLKLIRVIRNHFHASEFSFIQFLQVVYGSSKNAVKQLISMKGWK
jgi:glycosyltransferase involved in cell wall biosynthesis